MRKINILFIILFLYVSFVYSQNELSQKRDLLTQKQNQLVSLEQKLSTARSENNKAKEYLTTIEKQQKDKQFDFENKKNAFNRASKNVDLVSTEKINQLSNEYKIADKELREITTELKKAKLQEQETSKKLKYTISEKKQIEQNILNIKADIFDIQLREPVWSIGEAICNLAENETPDQCRKRALEAAQRDAMEKGGKMILESETIVKNYQLYLDEIRTHIKAQIIEQDSDPQYGVKREIVGNNIRYVAKLRLKIQSISEYNPYRIKIKQVNNLSHDFNKENIIIPTAKSKTIQNKHTIYCNSKWILNVDREMICPLTYDEVIKIEKKPFGILHSSVLKKIKSKETKRRKSGYEGDPNWEYMEFHRQLGSGEYDGIYKYVPYKYSLDKTCVWVGRRPNGRWIPEKRFEDIRRKNLKLPTW